VITAMTTTAKTTRPNALSLRDGCEFAAGAGRFECFWYVEYESPVPGRLTVLRTPLLETFVVNPFPPKESDELCFPKLMRTPGIIRMLLRNRNPMHSEIP